jgi:hypothetical protein
MELLVRQLGRIRIGDVKYTHQVFDSLLKPGKLIRSESKCLLLRIIDVQLQQMCLDRFPRIGFGT